MLASDALRFLERRGRGKDKSQWMTEVQSLPSAKVTSRKISAKVKKRPPKPRQDRRRKAQVIAAECFEQIRTAQIASFISGQMASRGLAPKTVNRFRDTVSALFTWAMTQFGVKMPEDKNPATAVKKLKESAPEIRFLTLAKVEMQLTALSDKHQLQAMVATLSYGIME